MADRVIKNSLNSIIDTLIDIRTALGTGDVPININGLSDDIFHLQSICIDNSYNEEELLEVYFEAHTKDREDNRNPHGVRVYFHGKDLFDTIVPTVEKREPSIFINDMDKMNDFLRLEGSEFLESYDYLTLDDYALTSAEFFTDTIDSLAELSRQAENMYIEELNGRDTGWHVTSDELKTSIMWYVQNHLDMDEQEEYEDLCNSMGI